MKTKTPSLKTLAKKADEYEKTRKERLAISKDVKELEAKEKALKSYLETVIQETEGLTSIGGATVTVGISEDEIPIVEDKDAFRKYINRTKRFDLAQALKPAAAPCKEMLVDGKEIPGIGWMKISKLTRSAK